MSEKINTTNKKLSAIAQPPFPLFTSAGFIALSKCFSKGLIHFVDSSMNEDEQHEWDLACITLRTLMISTLAGLTCNISEDDAGEIFDILSELNESQSKIFDLEN